MIYKGSKEKINDDSAAFNAALRLLTRREYSKSELLKKLTQRYSLVSAKNALSRCIDSGYQSDTRYADMLSRHYYACHYGPLKLVYAARLKGIGKELLQDFIDSHNWQSMAFEALVKKYGESELDYQMRLKALSFLQRRGFLKDQCIGALNEYMNLPK